LEKAKRRGQVSVEAAVPAARLGPRRRRACRYRNGE
jgi:hypothetical protein